MQRGRSTAQFERETRDGRWRRQPNRFTDRLSADGSTGFPAEPGRYHLYVSLACPWAHRQIITRELKGLQDVLPMTIVDPWRDERGWRFVDGQSDRWPQLRPDPVEGFRFLAEAYRASDPGFDGRVTVPCIWDTETRRIVTNDFFTIDVQLNEVFGRHASHPDVDLYPSALRVRIDEMSDTNYRDVNDGVYKAGFATTQEAYEEAFRSLFARLDVLEEHLSDRRYLVGDRLTLADVRLFTTLVRFDAVYHTHFRCNRHKLIEFPVLSAYARDLHQTPGFGSTTDETHIKRHYYATHDRLNPSRIVPLGPATDWSRPHGRASLTASAHATATGT